VRAAAPAVWLPGSRLLKSPATYQPWQTSPHLRPTNLELRVRTQRDVHVHRSSRLMAPDPPHEPRSQLPPGVSLYPEPQFPSNWPRCPSRKAGRPPCRLNRRAERPPGLPLRPARMAPEPRPTPNHQTTPDRRPQPLRSPALPLVTPSPSFPNRPRPRCHPAVGLPPFGVAAPSEHGRADSRLPLVTSSAFASPPAR